MFIKATQRSDVNPTHMNTQTDYCRKKKHKLEHNFKNNKISGRIPSFSHISLCLTHSVTLSLSHSQAMMWK